MSSATAKPRTKDQRAFLIRLASLVDEFNAEFSYTDDDDGIHISMPSGDSHPVYTDEIFVGLISSGDDLRNHLV